MDRASRPLVLVIEDDTILRDLLCRCLDHSGFEVCSASDGEEGFARFQESLAGTLQPIQAVITDFLMPRLDGRALARRIQDVRAGFPIVMVTGEAPDTAILELARMPNVLTLLKPFRMERLIQSVGHVLGRPLPGGWPDRRASSRVKTSLPCKLSRRASGKIGGSFAGIIRDLGFGGCRLDIAESLQPGEAVSISLDLSTAGPIPARVAWATPLPSCAGKPAARPGQAILSGSRPDPSSPSAAGLRFEAQADNRAFVEKLALGKLKQAGEPIFGASAL